MITFKKVLIVWLICAACLGLIILLAIYAPTFLLCALGIIASIVVVGDMMHSQNYPD